MKKAFTLAEVLITIGIIGIVATIVVPTIITNIHSKQWDSANKVFAKKLEDSLKVMNSQQTLAGHTSTESFVEELSKHFKTNKICSNDTLLDCFSNQIYWGITNSDPKEVDMSIIKASKNFGQREWDSNIVGVQFANGTSALIAYNPTETCAQDPHSNQINVNNCLAILYDTNGFKTPNQRGKDLRANGNVLSLGRGCAFEIGDTCYATSVFSPSSLTTAECNSLKSELGIKTCRNTGGDSWAGAVKACGGINKMPSMSQLAELANYVYNTTDIATYGKTSNLSLDRDKASAMGFASVVPSNYYVMIWSSEMTSFNDAYNMRFNLNNVHSNNYPRGSFSYAICLD